MIYSLITVCLGKFFRYALKYFSHYASVFESDVKDVPKKKKSDETITDLEIVETCFFLLKSNSNFYRNRWNWSVFVEKYFTHQDDKVKW